MSARITVDVHLISKKRNIGIWRLDPAVHLREIISGCAGMRQVCTAATTATRRCSVPSVPRARWSSWERRCTDDWRSGDVSRSTWATSAASATSFWSPTDAVPARESVRFVSRTQSSKARGLVSRSSRRTWKPATNAFKVCPYVIQRASLFTFSSSLPS